MKRRLNKRRYVATASTELSAAWDNSGKDGLPFLWLHMLTGDGKMIMVDACDIFTEIDPHMGELQVLSILSDAINVLTYEHNATDAVLSHLTFFSEENCFEHSRPILVFSYHGALGQYTNFRPMTIIGEDEQGRSVVLSKSELCQYNRPVADVTKWYRHGFSKLHDLVPYNKVVAKALSFNGKWHVGVNSVFPSELIFDSEVEAKRKVAKINGMANREYLRNLNKELYEIRKCRCPIKLEI